MRELIKSVLRAPWSIAALGARGMQDVFLRGNCRDCSKPGEGREGGLLTDLFETGNLIIDGFVDAAFRPFGPAGEADGASPPPGGPLPFPPAGPSTPSSPPSAPGPGTSSGAGSYPRPPAPPPPAPHQRGRLDPTTMVVIGESLAAGIGNFAVDESTQPFSFPAQLARQMGVGLTQPLFQAPGIGHVEGFPDLEQRLPRLEQSTVLRDWPPASRPGNLSVPGITVADAFRTRPHSPLVRAESMETALNMIVGLPDLRDGTDARLPTQVEAAVAQNPTLIIVALGYTEALRAVHEMLDEGRFVAPDRDTFHADCTRLFHGLDIPNAEGVVVTIPNPLDTAHLSSLETASQILKVDRSYLEQACGLCAGDYLTVHGLMELAGQIIRHETPSLSDRSVLRANAAEAVAEKWRVLNDVVREVAEAHRAVVYDLAALVADIAHRGHQVGSRRITGHYLGGFYSLNGFYPGPTGQAIIANDLLALINSHYGASFSPIDVAAVLADDPVAHITPAEGRSWSCDELTHLHRTPAWSGGDDSERAPDETRVRVRRINSPTHSAPPEQPLRLPAGLEQVLPLNEALTYHGDGMRIANCRGEQGVKFGSCGDLLFGGLAMFGSHLSGSIRIKFSEPVGNVTQFELSLVDGVLDGEDGVLAAPILYHFPLLDPKVRAIPNVTCTGELDLVSGFVSKLNFGFLFLNSGLAVLGKLNPVLATPAVLLPGQYGSAWARFDQRADGKLDFTFHGSTFAPLGNNVRYPLPFAGPEQQFATFEANGTAIHPHLHMSTVDTSAVPEESIEVPEIPTNEIVELTCCSNATSFGDDFDLTHPDLGTAYGRSMLRGRVQIQFGERFGDSVPIAVAMCAPAGVLEEPDYSPIREKFPGQLFPGLIGHNGVLHFPTRSYRQNDLALVSDPFDLALGAVNVKTGEVIGDFLQRGFLIQNVFFALIRVEPNAEQTSFGYRGPASFERGRDGMLRYRFNGSFFIPFPPGFHFPQPDMSNAFTIGAGSRLDPFLQIEAVRTSEPQRREACDSSRRDRGPFRLSGSASGLVATSNESFSYRYSITENPDDDRSMFVYMNHSQHGRFTLERLSSVSFVNSNGRRGENTRDTVSFTGFGRWEFSGPAAAVDREQVESRLHFVTAQISTDPEIPYVSVLIDGGRVSSVNTEPRKLTPPLHRQEVAEEQRHAG